jgi:hypothetical protein
LTRRANQWHNAIIATIVKSPRGENPPRAFSLAFRNRTTAARHDAAISPCTCLGVVSEPSSEPKFLPIRANVPARGVIGWFCTKNAEALGKKCRRHARTVFSELSDLGRRLRYKRRACYRISGMMRLAAASMEAVSNAEESESRRNGDRTLLVHYCNAERNS